MALNLARLQRMAAGVIVPYTQEHAAAHAEFAARMWPKNERRRSSNYNRWKYRAPNRGCVERHLLALWDGKVVGQVGMTPVQAHVGGRQVAAKWICDFMVDPDYRFRGFAPLLMAQAINTPGLTLGDNPTEMLTPVVKGFGFREFAAPYKMLLPLNAAQILSWKLPQKFRWLIPAVALLTRPFLKWRARKLLSRSLGKMATPCRWDDLLELVSRRQRDLDVPHVVHDRSFLEWRCPGAPGFSKEMRGLRTASGGYLLWGDDHPDRYDPDVHVFDWSAANADDCQALFSGVCQAAEELGARTISVLVNTPQEQAWLRNLGFLKVPTPVKVFCYPPQQIPSDMHRFHFCHYDAHADL